MSNLIRINVNPTVLRWKNGPKVRWRTPIPQILKRKPEFTLIHLVRSETFEEEDLFSLLDSKVDRELGDKYDEFLNLLGEYIKLRDIDLRKGDIVKYNDINYIYDGQLLEELWYDINKTTSTPDWYPVITEFPIGYWYQSGVSERDWINPSNLDITNITLNLSKNILDYKNYDEKHIFNISHILSAITERNGEYDWLNVVNVRNYYGGIDSIFLISDADVNTTDVYLQLMDITLLDTIKLDGDKFALTLGNYQQAPLKTFGNHNVPKLKRVAPVYDVKDDTVAVSLPGVGEYFISKELAHNIEQRRAIILSSNVLPFVLLDMIAQYDI